MRRVNLRELVSRPVFAKAERAQALMRLVANLADRDGSYEVGGRIAALERGQGVFTLSEMAELMGCTKDTARRHLEAFEKDGVVSVLERGDGLRLVDEGDKLPRGRLVSLCVGLEPEK